MNIGTAGYIIVVKSQDKIEKYYAIDEQKKKAQGNMFPGYWTYSLSEAKIFFTKENAQWLLKSDEFKNIETNERVSPPEILQAAVDNDFSKPVMVGIAPVIVGNIFPEIEVTGTSRIEYT
jgi:hypothetical protein